VIIIPKKTFFNLDEEKKDRILNAALDEFAEYYYHEASVNRIVERADIAKGSFYQYFQNKKDIFMYLVSWIGEKKIDYMKEILSNIYEVDFFQGLRNLYISGIKFAIDNPRLEAIGNKIFKGGDDSVLKELLNMSKPSSIEFFISLLDKGIEKGEVDSKINVNLVANMLTNLNMSLGEFIYEDGKLDMKDMGVIDEMLYLIENGIKYRVNNK
jgi:AcrR family transcriptional regulator